ncbi:MAG: lytic murein transglycosylase [bacterium]
MKKNLKGSLVFVFTVLILGGGFLFFYQKSEAQVVTDPAQRAALQAQLTEIEKEITQQQGILAQKQTEGVSISRDIAILNAKISESELKIKAYNIAINQLGQDIVLKTQTIQSLGDQISSGKDSLSQILRQTKVLDDVSLPEVLLSGKDISSFFVDLDSFDAVKTSLADTFNNLMDAQQENQKEKTALNTKKNATIDTKVNVQSEEAIIKQSQAEKKKLQALNKTEQAGYQAIIASKSAQAAQIRAALFSLANTAAIPFGTALEYAQVVQKSTGVDPAFLLAIVTQESNLGANVGACYLTNASTGAGVNVTSGKVWSNLMKPSRDVTPFLNITKAVGRDPYKTKVSCPIAGAGGYGGAMGPAQFIPSTWVLFEDRIESYLGVKSSDPWNPEHAFMASGLYLADLGGINGSYTGEIKAACKYYGSGGSTCAYGKQVMAKVAQIQANINILNN